MSKMGLHHPFGHLKHKLWPKEKSRINLAIWFPTTKSLESTWFTCVQVTCDTSIENSWWGLQLCFKPHLHRRSVREVMGLQSRESPNFGNFGGFPLGSPGTKSHLDLDPVGSHKIYYKGEGDGFPQVWAVVSLVNPSCMWLVQASKVLQLCINTLCWFCVGMCEWVKLINSS
jgi:hypothetical protein